MGEEEEVDVISLLMWARERAGSGSHGSKIVGNLTFAKKRKKSRSDMATARL